MLLNEIRNKSSNHRNSVFSLALFRISLQSFCTASLKLVLPVCVLHKIQVVLQ